MKNQRNRKPRVLNFKISKLKKSKIIKAIKALKVSANKG